MSKASAPVVPFSSARLGPPRKSRIGSRSMIDSDCAQPIDDRSTRNRPYTTDTLAAGLLPSGHGLANDLGAQRRHPSAGNGVRMQRLDVGPGRRPGGGHPVVRCQKPPLEQLADRQKGSGPTDRPVFSELDRQLTPTLLGVHGCAVEPEGPLDRPARDWVDPDRHPDLEDAGAAFTQRPLAPDAHRRKNRVKSRVIGGSLLCGPRPRFARLAGRTPLADGCARRCTRRDSNPQSSDP